MLIVDNFIQEQAICAEIKLDEILQDIHILIVHSVIKEYILKGKVVRNEICIKLTGVHKSKIPQKSIVQRRLYIATVEPCGSILK